MDTNGKIAVASGIGLAFFVGVCYGIGIADTLPPTTSNKGFAPTTRKERDRKIVMDAMLEQMTEEQQAAAWRTVSIRTRFADIVNKF